MYYDIMTKSVQKQKDGLYDGITDGIRVGEDLKGLFEYRLERYRNGTKTYRKTILGFVVDPSRDKILRAVWSSTDVPSQVDFVMESKEGMTYCLDCMGGITFVNSDYKVSEFRFDWELPYLFKEVN